MLPVGVEVEVVVFMPPPVLIPWAFMSLEYRLTLCFISLILCRQPLEENPKQERWTYAAPRETMEHSLATSV